MLVDVGLRVRNVDCLQRLQSRSRGFRGRLLLQNVRLVGRKGKRRVRLTRGILRVGGEDCGD